MQTPMDLWPALNLESWKERGKPKAEDMLIDRAKMLYTESLKASGKNLDLIKRGEELIKKIMDRR
jgi:hypothetical protein